MTDAELVRQACEGDRSAQEQLVRRWSPCILAICRARIGRWDAAEDLAQEALLRGLTRLDTLKQPAEVGAWLRGIAVHVCLDWLRTRKRTAVPFSAVAAEWLPPEDGGPTLGNQMEQQERSDRLRTEIEALPEDLRETLLLFYYDEVTYDEIAELLGVSRATVNARLSKARARLTQRLATLMR